MRKEGLSKMKKIIDWANKLPKTLPLILIGIYFIVSLILSRVGTGNGTTSLLSIMTLILQCVVAFLLLFGVYRTDKKIRGGQRVNPYGKLIVIVFHSVLALACIGMIIMGIHMAISQTIFSQTIFSQTIFWLCDSISLLPYLFAWLFSLLNVLSWETTAKIGKKSAGTIAGIAVVVLIVLAFAPIKDCETPNCFNKTGLFSKYCVEHEHIINNADSW